MSRISFALPLFLLAFVLFPCVDAATVTRTLSSDNIPPGGELTVTLQVDTSGARDFYAIDEVYPHGWEVIDAGVGSTSHQGHWKQVVIEGATDAEYSYKLRAPDSPGKYTFSGEFMFGGMENTEPIGGQNTVTVGGISSPVMLWLVPLFALLIVIALYLSYKRKQGK